MKTIPVPTLDSLEKAAKNFVTGLKDTRVVAISGEMGAGKTTFIQAVCRVMGVSDIVNSPTFALINEYFLPGGDSIYHFDLYRVETPVELYDIGYEDYFYSDAYCFIEWPERAIELIPEDALFIRIDVLEDGSRRIREWDVQNEV